MVHHSTDYALKGFLVVERPTVAIILERLHLNFKLIIMLLITTLSSHS